MRATFLLSRQWLISFRVCVWCVPPKRFPFPLAEISVPSFKNARLARDNTKGHRMRVYMRVRGVQERNAVPLKVHINQLIKDCHPFLLLDVLDVGRGGGRGGAADGGAVR